MISIDTNVVIRFLTNDEPKQATVAEKLISSQPCSIALTVFLEAEWVLRALMGYARENVARAFHDLVTMNNIIVPHYAALMLALHAYEQGMDFADALHVAQTQEGESFATFDKDFAKRAPKAGFKNVTLLK